MAENLVNLVKKLLLTSKRDDKINGHLMSLWVSD